MSETGTMAGKNDPLRYVAEALGELRAKGVAPKLRVLEGEQRPVCVFDGREVINLASNNYLGLTSDKRLRKASIEAVRKYGVGAGAVRTIAGTMKLHMELEEQIAKFKNVEACVVFQSGFTANAGTVSAVLGKEDLIISDELNHASIIDGARLSRATIKVFKHKDVADCEQILQENAAISGEEADYHGRRVFDGRGHCAAAGALRPGGEIWLHHDGGRRACERRAGKRRARDRGSFELPRARAHSGGDAEQGDRVDGRVCLRFAGFD